MSTAIVRCNLITFKNYPNSLRSRNISCSRARGTACAHLCVVRRDEREKRSLALRDEYNIFSKIRKRANILYAMTIGNYLHRIASSQASNIIIIIIFFSFDLLDGSSVAQNSHFLQRPSSLVFRVFPEIFDYGALYLSACTIKLSRPNRKVIRCRCDANKIVRQYIILSSLISQSRDMCFILVLLSANLS